jgi:hypothetical protein
MWTRKFGNELGELGETEARRVDISRAVSSDPKPQVRRVTHLGHSRKSPVRSAYLGVERGALVTPMLLVPFKVAWETYK